MKPGEVPPVEDRSLIANSASGAFYFASYFYRAIDWSIATTNPNLLRAISAPSCKPCTKYIQEIDALAAAGGHSEGARLQVSAYAPAEGDLLKADYVIQVTINQAPQVLVAKNGTRATPSPPSNPAINYLYMSWDNGGFVATEIGG